MCSYQTEGEPFIGSDILRLERELVCGGPGKVLRPCVKLDLISAAVISRQGQPDVSVCASTTDVRCVQRQLVLGGVLEWAGKASYGGDSTFNAESLLSDKKYKSYTRIGEPM